MNAVMLVNRSRKSCSSLGGTSSSSAFPKHGLPLVPGEIQACPTVPYFSCCNGTVAPSWQREPRGYDQCVQEVWEIEIVARGFQAMHTKDGRFDAPQAVPVAHALQSCAEMELLECLNGKRKQIPLMRNPFPQK